MQSFNEPMMKWEERGFGQRVSLVLEKAAQVAQVVIAIAMIALCIQFSHMATLVADMKLDQGKDSPVANVLAAGIQVRRCAIGVLS